MADTKKRVAIITGAGSGIGEETTYTFARQGVFIAMVDLQEDRLVKVMRKCQEIGLSEDMILKIKCDLAEETSFDDIVDQTVATFGQIDILVNNAGLVSTDGVMTMEVKSMDKLYNVMLRAPFFLCQKALPHLKKSKGHIINIASMAANVASAWHGYATIKAGLQHFSKCLALDVASDGVRVNTINPGFVKTPLLSDCGIENLDKFCEAQSKIVPLGRVGEVTDIASAILFLTSESASFITGISLNIDGGAVLLSPWK